MVDLILLGILLVGFLVGIRRGFILQVVHLTGFIAAFIVAYFYSSDLAPQLRLWIPYPGGALDSGSLFAMFDNSALEMGYYRAIAFALLFFVTKVIWRIIGSMLDFLADLPLLRTVNRWLGGALGLIEVYLMLFLVLYISALVPVEQVQGVVANSFVAQGIVEGTPVFSSQLKDLWLS